MRFTVCKHSLPARLNHKKGFVFLSPRVWSCLKLCTPDRQAGSSVVAIAWNVDHATAEKLKSKVSLYVSALLIE